MHMGLFELLIVLAIVLIFVGPKQIPKLAETCGRTITSFKKGIKENVSEESETVDEPEKENG